MDAKNLEEKQSLQTHVAVLFLNAHEEKQIAIARLNAKLQVRDNQFSALQEYREKYHQMMNENSIPQRPSEPVTPQVVQNSRIPPVGAHPSGTSRFKRPTNSNDPDPPASDSGPSEGRRRWGGPPGGSDPDLHEPPGRAPDRIPDSKKSKASNITLPALPSPPEFHLWRSSVRDAFTASYEYNPDAAHSWIAAVEKLTATFDLIAPP